ncbi:MAG: cytochrome c3 family protein [Proteobacteria bacterium]|nr:cytochrome c3 family protein [Pseudomonadota bacterium]
MRQSIKIPVLMIVVFAFFMIINMPTTAVSGSDKSPRINKHADPTCRSCHAMGKPYARPGDDTCMNCHDSYAKLAEETASLENLKAGIENPHKSHMGEARCTLCHKNHAPSVLYCNECHSPKFDMEVP